MRYPEAKQDGRAGESNLDRHQEGLIVGLVGHCGRCPISFAGQLAKELLDRPGPMPEHRRSRDEVDRLPPELEPEAARRWRVLALILLNLLYHPQHAPAQIRR